ncbi:hypothetical protein GA0070603_0536 [Micromonospora chersina]|uniref:Uncharacterized protein n=1 Tax=Micromonospora chersina TaxID=47854 RepID=A0A1C6U2V1_9ACTN|nr:hypothetical protein GA0070603_0536 [Micromonospora chersina]
MFSRSTRARRQQRRSAPRPDRSTRPRVRWKSIINSATLVLNLAGHAVRLYRTWKGM